MTEADTCREFVTPKLVAAGWGTSRSDIGEQHTFMLTNELASMQHFNFKNADQRSAVPAAKAVELWPIP